MSESRVLDCFGPNLIIETNGSVGVAGQLKYQLYSVTDGGVKYQQALYGNCLLYTSPSPRDRTRSRMPSSA